MRRGRSALLNTLIVGPNNSCRPKTIHHWCGLIPKSMGLSITDAIRARGTSSGALLDSGFDFSGPGSTDTV